MCSGVASASLDLDPIMQFTGLLDKNVPPISIFEGDIVSLEGKVIGNVFQESALIEQETNLLATIADLGQGHD